MRKFIGAAAVAAALALSIAAPAYAARPTPTPSSTSSITKGEWVAVQVVVERVGKTMREESIGGVDYWTVALWNDTTHALDKPTGAYQASDLTAATAAQLLAHGVVNP